MGKTKAVAQYEVNGKLVRIYKSMKDAEQQNEGFVTEGGISACINGYKRTHGGYLWTFYDLENDKAIFPEPGEESRYYIGDKR